MSKHVEIAVTTHGSPASSLSNPSRSAASIAPFAADQLSSPKRASRCQLNDTQGYPQTIHSNRVFHDFHHPFWSTPIFGNIQNISFCRVFFGENQNCEQYVISHRATGKYFFCRLQTTPGTCASSKAKSCKAPGSDLLIFSKRALSWRSCGIFFPSAPWNLRHQGGICYTNLQRT